MSDVLFVYGTLMRGEHAHALVASAERIEPATIAGRLWDTGRGYPAVIEAPDGASRVEGEALFFAELASLLPRLDGYEGYDPASEAGSLYLRVRRPISPVTARQSRASGYARQGSLRAPLAIAADLELGEPARTIEGWVYVMPADREARLVAGGGRPIPGGRWKKPWTSPP